eukprot:2045750-Rhodomonas_salina.2
MCIRDSSFPPPSSQRTGGGLSAARVAAPRLLSARSYLPTLSPYPITLPPTLSLQPITLPPTLSLQPITLRNPRYHPKLLPTRSPLSPYALPCPIPSIPLPYLLSAWSYPPTPSSYAIPATTLPPPSYHVTHHPTRPPTSFYARPTQLLVSSYAPYTTFGPAYARPTRCAAVPLSSYAHAVHCVRFWLRLCRYRPKHTVCTVSGSGLDYAAIVLCSRCAMSGTDRGAVYERAM